MYYYGHMFGWWLGGALMTFFFWLVVIWLIVAAVRGFSMHQSYPHSHRALDILKERYAKGEIDRNEYVARKKDLGD